MSFVLFHTHLVACSYSIYSDVHKHNTPLAEYHTRIGLHYKLTCYISSSVTVQYVSLRHCCMQKNQPRPSSNFEFGWLGRGLLLDTHFGWSEKSSNEWKSFFVTKYYPKCSDRANVDYSVWNIPWWMDLPFDATEQQKLYVRSVYSNRFEIECTGTFDFPCPLHLLLFPRPLLIDFRWNFLQSGM